MRPLVESLRRLWIFDFDGTLSPLVAERSAARMLPEARETLIELVHLPGQHVAVLSSRMLDDLIPRVGVPGIYLGGGSGTEWLLPDSSRVVAEDKIEPLQKAREEMVQMIETLKIVPGVDMEDKKWSVAVHVRRATPGDKKSVAGLLTDWARTAGIRIMRGPEVFEIQIVPEVDKLFGVRTLCKLAGFEPESVLVTYCGDDENDSVAMDWVIRQGGLALSVGPEPLVHGAKAMDNPEALVREVRKLAGLNMG